MKNRSRIMILTIITIVAVAATVFLYVRNNSELEVVDSKPFFATEHVSDEYTFDLPSTFTIMDEEQKNTKYPQGVVNAWSSPNGDANIVINESLITAGTSDIALFKQTIRATFDNIYPDIVWDNEREQLIDGRKSILIEFTANNQKNRLIIVEDGKKWKMISFNYSSNQAEQWRDIGEKVIDSIKFPTIIQAVVPQSEGKSESDTVDDVLIVPEDVIFTDSAGDFQIKIGMSKEEIDALLGTSVHDKMMVKDLDIYKYRNCEIIYMDNKAVSIQIRGEYLEEYLHIGTAVHIGASEQQIIDKYGKPPFTSDPKNVLKTSNTLFYLFQFEGDNIIKLPSEDSAIDKKDVYILSISIKDDKTKIFSLMDYEFMKSLE